MSVILRRKGTMAVQGEHINKIALQWLEKYCVPMSARQCRSDRDGSDFHVTIISPAEMGVLQSGIELPAFLDDVMDYGANCIREHVWYVAIYSSWVDKWRKSLGLEPKDLHITLGFNGHDIHDHRKNGISIWQEMNSMVKLVDAICLSNSSERIAKDLIILEHVAYELVTCVSSTFVSCKNSCKAMQDREKLRTQEKTLKAIGQWALQQRHTDLAQTIGMALYEHGSLFGLKIVLNCYQRRGRKPDVQYVMSKLPMPAVTNVKIPHNLCMQLKKINDHIEFPSCHKHTVVLAMNFVSHDGCLDTFTLPRNFSWVNVNQGHGVHNADSTGSGLVRLLAGSAIPTSHNDIVALASVGIRLILTIHEMPLSTKLLGGAAGFGMTCRHVPVTDRTPITDMELLVNICDMMHTFLSASDGVLVHCQGGVGRTNFVIIAYMIKYYGLSAADATAQVAGQRRVLLDQKQEDMLKTWWVHVNSSGLLDSQDNVTATAVVGSKCNPILTTLPPLLLFCGMAASGKSTVAKTLVQAHPDVFVRVNKDDMRGKGECDRLLHSTLKSRGKVAVLDCCNLTPEKRAEWLACAPGVRAWCVYFDFPVEECRYRIRRRQDHPIIPAGEAGVTILKSMERQLIAPSASEGFEQVIVLTSESQVDWLMSEWHIDCWSAPEDAVERAEGHHNPLTDALVKFPKICHGVNLGAATRDDKIASFGDIDAIISSGAQVTVEEKIDGANMGIFITSEGQIIAQNRSHFVNSNYHPQFGPLDKWIARHLDDLWEILQPGVNILYGEWVYATHSVRYDQLPGYFIAFDLYDRATGSFASRKSLLSALSGTKIPVVPVVYEGQLASIAQAVELVNGPSQFASAGVMREGVVIRLCSGGAMTARIKLVRAGFVAGNERWNRSSKLATNELTVIK